MIDKISSEAPLGKYRVIILSTALGIEDRVLGDYKHKLKAISAAQKCGKQNFNTHVYDDQGNHIYEAGKF